MKKQWLTAISSLFLASILWAQDTPKELALTEAENAAVAAILAKAQATAGKDDQLSAPAQTQAQVKEELDQQDPETTEEDEQTPKKCLTVAFVDIDEAFNAHPRTVAVKEQIRLKILSKEEEVASAKELIARLHEENGRLVGLMRQLKPFYERIVVEPHKLSPRPLENADELELGNILNRLTFAGTDVFYASPLNTPAQLEDLKARIASNKQTIEEREFFIDNYKAQTREEILKLEEKEVKEILKDIYTEIKSFAQKRNIGAVVRKDEVLYGQKPVNVTKDFINRLKKAKKYRKRGK